MLMKTLIKNMLLQFYYTIMQWGQPKFYWCLARANDTENVYVFTTKHHDNSM